MTANIPSRPRGAMRPGAVLESFAPQETEGAGNAGCPMHPQPVCIGSKHTVVTTGSPVSSGIPCTMVLTAYSALSPATNSSCHRHRRIESLAGPGRARKTSANLTPATGARTTRLHRTQQPQPNVPTGHVQPAEGLAKMCKRRSSARRRSLTGNPPCEPVHAPDAAASTASHPASVTIAIRPSFGIGRASL